MQRLKAERLISSYRDELLLNVVPFWIEHAVDHEHGGFLHCLDRDGSALSTDKGIWVQGRFTWLLARLCNEVEARPEWLELATRGIDFLSKFAFDEDGRAFFIVTRDGRPLRKRRYIYGEAFVTMALAEYARALLPSPQGEQYADRAGALFRLILHYLDTPGLLEPKVNPAVRPMKAHGIPMILLCVTQVLRGLGHDALCDAVAERACQEILAHFVHPEVKALLETVGPAGERLEGPEGRIVVPGHAIETAWFLMLEGVRRSDDRLIREACRILEWSLELGWDGHFGGLLYYVDIEGKPPDPYEHDMKLWWPHTEAVYATLLAHVLTGQASWLEWHERLHEWTWRHFPDGEHGEWYGYLHRDGTVSSRAKGNMWKGPFHLPRMLLYSWKLLQASLEGDIVGPVPSP